jgi:hypothetical protein
MGLAEKHRNERFLGYGLIKPLELIICYHRANLPISDFVARLRRVFSQAEGVRITDYRAAEILLVEQNSKRYLGPLFESGTTFH